MVLEIEKSNEILKDVPGMIFDQAVYMDNFLKKHNLTNLLELGFAHGASSCYMASTLREMGEGHLTTIDLKGAKFRLPNIETLLDKLDLNDLVTPYYENTSYTWRLMKFIEDNDEPIFDFCYVDGAHDWYNDGFAFFLVDKLLKPGGWIIFDDMFWTFESSPALKNTSRVKNMPDDEKLIPHISQVFNLLVKSHPNYCNFEIHKSWGIAQKKL